MLGKSTRRLPRAASQTEALRTTSDDRPRLRVQVTGDGRRSSRPRFWRVNRHSDKLGGRPATRRGWPLSSPREPSAPVILLSVSVEMVCEALYSTRCSQCDLAWLSLDHESVHGPTTSLWLCLCSGFEAGTDDGATSAAWPQADDAQHLCRSWVLEDRFNCVYSQSMPMCPKSSGNQLSLICPTTSANWVGHG